MTRHNDIVYLRHMNDHAREAIQILGATSREAFFESRVLQLAVMHLIEIVGEAANRVLPETRAALADLPWRDIVGMRNRITHGYDSIKTTLVWETVKQDFPVLIDVLDAYLARFDQ